MVNEEKESSVRLGCAGVRAQDGVCISVGC